MTVILFLLGSVYFGIGLQNFLTCCDWRLIIDFIASGFCFAAAVFSFLEEN